MPATVVSGLTNITLANNNTGFGVWKRDGTGGTPSAISEADVFIQGTGACSVKVSNQGVVLAYATGGLNLSASNTHLYIWANMLAGGLMTNRSSNGLCIFVSSDSTLTTGSNYKMWAVDGADTYPGGWVRYVIDLSKTATVTTGTLNLSSVQHVGMYCDTRPNTAKFDNLVIDRIDYTTGVGLRVYGTSTTDDLFSDILSEDEGTVGNKYGILTSKEGIIYQRGCILLGDNVGTSACNLTDIDKIIVIENPTYYDGSAEANCLGVGFSGIQIVGNSTGSTTLQFGKKVGSGDNARGRNGVTILGSLAGAELDFDDGNANSVKVYGSKFQNITQTLSWGSNATHECIGNTFDACKQFDPVGGIVIRNTVFSNYDGAEGALLWNSSIDIKNSNFIANSNGSNSAGIYHTSTGTFTYDGLQFSGNDYQAYNNSGGVITINAAGGSNVTGAEIRNGTSASTTVNNNTNITLSGLPTGGVEVRIYDDTGSPGSPVAGTEIAGSENVTSGSFSFSDAATNNIIIVIFDEENTREGVYLQYVVPSSDTTIPFTLLADRNYLNP